MTSLSRKNHPITAPRTGNDPAQRRSLWKQFLTGALCLCFAGALPANDREAVKPLDRLKQRSARQRWREMRGEVGRQQEGTPATNPPVEPQAPEMTPFSTWMRTQPRPIPAKSSQPVVSDVDVPAVAPVPAAVSVDSETTGEVANRPGAKPPADINEPTHHPGSFGDVVIESRAATPRQRVGVPLPHWPFQDDLDLVGQDPFAESSDVTDASRPAPASVAAESSTPVQVAELPTEQAASSNLVADEVPPAPPAEDAPFPELDGDPTETGKSPVPLADPVHRLKAISAIQPFYDYTPNGGDPSESLCPRPANADPNKPYKQCPEESSLLENGSLERNNAVMPVYWTASNVYHNPLYFEDPALERTGHTFSDLVQPFVSVGRFGVQCVALPYSVALDPYWKHETPLGQYRPGDVAPKRHLAVPLNAGAAATAAAAYTGIIFLTP